MNIDNYVKYWGRYRKDDLCVSFAGQQLTWGEFDRAAGKLAQHLLAIGIQPGDRFGCLLDNCIEWCVGYAAAIRCGAIMVPLNAMFGDTELQAIASDAECSAVLSVPDYVKRLETDPGDASGIGVFDLANGHEHRDYLDIISADGEAPRNEASGDEVLAICYTSGTTGVPKGIALTHNAVEKSILYQGGRFGWESGEERILILAPLAFTGGIISNLSAALIIGASFWLEKNVDPKQALDALLDNKITHIGGVPALYQRIAAAPRFAEADLSYMKAANTGGAPVPAALLQTFAEKGIVIRQQYGNSENCGGLTCPDSASALANPDSCGPPLPGVEIEIRGEKGQVLPAGEVGELYVRGELLMQGYWNNPGLTAEAFDGDWYKSGDLGRTDESGNIYITDRKKNMIISGGVNIYPAEVERAMSGIGSIVELAVFGLPSDEWGEEVNAIVYAPSANDTKAILEESRKLLGSVKAPKNIRLSNNPLPRTASNKIARTGLQDLYRSLEP